VVKNLAPDWARRINYTHHSNPGTRHFSRAVFDKCYVRPRVDYAWKIIKGEIEDNEISKEQAGRIIKMYKYDSAPMIMGRTVQKIVDARLLDPDELEKTYKQTNIEVEKSARQELINYTPFEHAPNDDLKHKACLDALDDTVEQAVNGILEAMKRLGINRLRGETNIFMEDVPGIALPYNFKPDFSDQIELKIKCPSISSYIKKDGTRTISKGKLPSILSPSWLNQVSAYYAHNKRRPSLVVANEDDYRIFDETEEQFLLSEPSLVNAWENILAMLKAHEHNLKASYDYAMANNFSNEEIILSVIRSVVPDFSDWSWKNINPDFLEEARTMWGFNAN
tara:strand:- start:680 stop:1690 length:1011 start_codon:yes stop_codon:yes gene_type:complete